MEKPGASPAPGFSFAKRPAASRCREPANRKRFILAGGGSDAHSRTVQASIARKLISLLLLAVLIAGGESLASMPTPLSAGSPPAMDMQKSDMSCKACGLSKMAAVSCDAQCAAVPAIATAVIDLSRMGSHEPWIIRSDGGATLSIGPDPAPPRASLS
ncbi:MAG TPA: hypothetical protein VGQ35_21335 [Dongiaceae bacterium]|jgi:hypothetical protein|nr:hypothetical protein [Dongiaceae bacterium]